MDVLRCVKCKRTYYTPNARTLLAGDPRCSQCHAVLMHEGEIGAGDVRGLGESTSDEEASQ